MPPIAIPAPPCSAQSSNSLHTAAKRSTFVLSDSILRVIRRQNSNPNIIPTTYGSIDSGPSPGAVVGIVLGSVGGFLLVLWLIYTCLNFGTISSRSSYTESVAVRERRKSHGSTRRKSETVEIRRERSPVRIVREPSISVRVPPPPERVERVIVEERRETRREREVSRDGSDEVVVIEEHSPPRRKKSDRRREEERRDSGYRTVDPVAFGGAVGGRTSKRGR